MKTSAKPVYGMASYSELGNILTSTTQDDQVREDLLRYARPANMPPNKEISKPMQRRLISSMLIDIEPEHCKEIIQVILPKTTSNKDLYTSIILDLIPNMSYKQRSEMIGRMLIRTFEDHDEDQYDRWIRDMSPFILKTSPTVSQIIIATKYSSEEERKNMVKFVLDNIDLHDQRGMIESMLPKTRKDMLKKLISSLLANSSRDHRTMIIDSVLGTVLGFYEQMIKTICSQALDNAELFNSLVASMLTNTGNRHYRGMVETLLKAEGSDMFRNIVL